MIPPHYIDQLGNPISPADIPIAALIFFLHNFPARHPISDILPFLLALAIPPLHALWLLATKQYTKD